MTARICPVDPLRPDSAVIQQAADIICNGGTVVFPTRCLYGLAVDALNPQAVKRLFSIKQRPTAKPILVLVSDYEMLARLIGTIPEAAQNLMARFWPGKLTLILPVGDKTLDHLTCGTGGLGVRLPGHPVAHALVSAAGRPISGTSANRSGQPGLSKCPAADSFIGSQIDMALDAGNLEGGEGSTVIDCTKSRSVIVREGAVPAEALKELL